MSETLPIPVFAEHDTTPEELRLKYRFLDLRKDKLHRNIMLRDTFYRGIHPVEAMFLNLCRDFAAEAVETMRFFYYNGAIRFLEGFQHGFHIKRAQGTQVNDLNFDAFLRQIFGSFH